MNYSYPKSISIESGNRLEFRYYLNKEDAIKAASIAKELSLNKKTNDIFAGLVQPGSIDSYTDGDGDTVYRVACP